MSENNNLSNARSKLRRLRARRVNEPPLPMSAILSSAVAYVLHVRGCNVLSFQNRSPTTQAILALLTSTEEICQRNINVELMLVCVGNACFSMQRYLCVCD